MLIDEKTLLLHASGDEKQLSPHVLSMFTYGVDMYLGVLVACDLIIVNISVSVGADLCVCPNGDERIMSLKSIV